MVIVLVVDTFLFLIFFYDDSLTAWYSNIGRENSSAYLAVWSGCRETGKTQEQSFSASQLCRCTKDM